MKTWNRTEINWRLFRTKIKASNEAKGIILLQNMLMISNRTSRTGTLVFDINNGNELLEEKDAMGWVASFLCKKLSEVCTDRKFSEFALYRPIDMQGGVQFELSKGESFCDAAIKIAKLVFAIFGQENPDSIGDFRVYQSTLVRHKGLWMTFKQYLVEKHNLPKDEHTEQLEIQSRWKLIGE